MGTSGSNSEGEKVEKYERGDIVGESNHRSKKWKGIVCVRERESEREVTKKSYLCKNSYLNRSVNNKKFVGECIWKCCLAKILK